MAPSFFAFPKPGIGKTNHDGDIDWSTDGMTLLEYYIPHTPPTTPGTPDTVKSVLREDWVSLDTNPLEHINQQARYDARVRLITAQAWINELKALHERDKMANML